VRDGFLEKSMTAWVDTLFDHFQDFAYEFNRSVSAVELSVKVERPTPHVEVLSYNAWREPEKTMMLFKGWGSTKKWTILVRGTKDNIESYVVPVERAISITRAQSTYAPMVRLDSIWEKGKVSWRQGEAPMDQEELVTIAQELF